MTVCTMQQSTELFGQLDCFSDKVFGQALLMHEGAVAIVYEEALHVHPWHWSP